MRALKSFIAISLILALMPILASAKLEDIEITGKSIENAAAGSSIAVKLVLDNKGNENLNIGISKDPFVSLESSWFEYVMVEPNAFKMEGLEKRDITVNVKLKKTVPTGASYKTVLTFYQLDKAENQKDYEILIRAVPPEEVLVSTVDADEMVMPGKDYAVKVSLKNSLDAVLPESEIFVSSDLFEEKKSLIMLPWQEREEEFSFAIPENTSPGMYTLNVRVYYDAQLVNKESIDFEVSSVTDVGGDETIEKRFLWKRISVVRQSTGNSATETSYQTRLTKFEQLFASYNVEPTEINGETAKWSFTLNPGSEYRVSTTVNYRTLLWAVLALIAFAVFAFAVFKRGVTMKKEIMSHRTTHDGFTDIKVRIHVKNHDKTPLHDAILMEVLPHHMHPKMEFGTLKPEAIERGEKGVRLKWNLEHVEGHEERIITYILSTKIGIIGDVELQPALLRFKNKAGRIISVSSNRISFSSGKRDISAPKERTSL